ncbi:hypothetical protein [Amycolatopsis australiensis]|uniref:NB-ARC domain-containing protein n=1 Tax=Amycolatopsis australiensis TaxID=546364 RepID=A0A1K1SQT7_9PSEU|nr:hypothetical protein [Amycolatopsis australiensis]SFW86683.1 hypothetical protein SAMN04489730_6470 [Amycolatopsis australiensis]
MPAARADGVVFVSLAELQDPDLLAGTFAEELDLVDRSARPPMEVLVEGLRARRTLLVLDNCEHLVAVCAHPVEISEDNIGDAVRLCRSLEGLPLAIELAAVRLRVLPAGEIADRLDEQFTLLTAGGPQVGPNRHETLRALTDWSYRLCTPAEQLLWARLSVFAHDFDLGAAEESAPGTGSSRPRSSTSSTGCWTSRCCCGSSNTGWCGTGCWRRCASSARRSWSPQASCRGYADVTATGACS